MKQLFFVIAKGLGATIIMMDNYECVLSCTLRDGITPVTLKINYFGNDFKVYILHGFLGRSFGAKGSKAFIEANTNSKLLNRLNDFICNPERYVGSIKGRSKSKRKDVIQAVTVRIGKRNYHTGLYKNELDKFTIVNPTDLQKAPLMKVRGTANKAAKSGAYQAMLRPKGI